MTQESPNYRFPEGIPAFEQEVEFRIVRNVELDPLLLLVSQRDPALRFVCIQARFLSPGYTFTLDEASAMLLETRPGAYAASDERFGCLAILSFPEDGPATANLLAPVIIHHAALVGMQAVQSAGTWSHAEPVGTKERGDVSHPPASG